MENYVQANHIDIGYNLWEKGYRVNPRNFTERQFITILNAANQVNDDIEITFNAMFQIMLEQHPDWFINLIEEDERYRRENEPKVREYFHKHFEGKTWEEIDQNRWDFYSDWHKDVFGYRPHGIVCGIYIDPHAEV